MNEPVVLFAASPIGSYDRLYRYWGRRYNTTRRGDGQKLNCWSRWFPSNPHQIVQTCLAKLLHILFKSFLGNGKLPSKPTERINEEEVERMPKFIGESSQISKHMERIVREKLIGFL